jgi:hypothetical protein
MHSTNFGEKNNKTIETAFGKAASPQINGSIASIKGSNLQFTILNNKFELSGDDVVIAFNKPDVAPQPAPVPIPSTYVHWSGPCKIDRGYMKQFLLSGSRIFNKYGQIDPESVVDEQMIVPNPNSPIPRATFVVSRTPGYVLTCVANFQFDEVDPQCPNYGALIESGVTAIAILVK